MSETLLVTLLIVLMIPAIIGVFYLKEFIMAKLLNYTTVFVLNKDGTYNKYILPLKNKKSISLDGHTRMVDPKGRFTGKDGNVFIYVGENSKPVTIEGIHSEVDTEDVSTIATLSFYAGKLSGMKSMNKIEMLMYLNLAAVALMVVLLIMYWQDRTKAFDLLREAVVRLKAISP